MGGIAGRSWLGPFIIISFLILKLFNFRGEWGL